MTVNRWWRVLRMKAFWGCGLPSELENDWQRKYECCLFNDAHQSGRSAGTLTYAKSLRSPSSANSLHRVAFCGSALYIWAPHWLPRWLAGFGTHRKPITTPFCQPSRSPSGGQHARPLHYPSHTHFNKQRREKPETWRVTDLMFTEGLVCTGKHCIEADVLKCLKTGASQRFCFHSADVGECQTSRTRFTSKGILQGVDSKFLNNLSKLYSISTSSLWLPWKHLPCLQHCHILMVEKKNHLTE
ncbi:uncharacterized protein [Pseudorasbora parva]